MSAQILAYCSGGDECESAISEPEGSQVKMRKKKRRKRLLNTSAFLEEMLSDEDGHSQHISPSDHDVPRRTTDTDHSNGENLDVTPIVTKGKGTYLLASASSTGIYSYTCAS